MAKIKKVRFPLRRWRRDYRENAFWDEFLRLEGTSQSMMDGKDNARLVTITVRDEETGEEWIFERVHLIQEQGGVKSKSRIGN